MNFSCVAQDLSHQQWVFVSWQKNNHLCIQHAMSHAQSLLLPHLTSSAHSTRTLIQTSLLFPSHGDDHCDDPRHGATLGQIAEQTLLQVMSPTISLKRLIQRSHRYCSTDRAWRRLVILLRALPLLLLNRIWTMSKSGYAGFTTVPTGEREREASADQPRVYHSYREKSVSNSLHFRASAGRPAAVFSHKRKSSQESHSDRDGPNR